MTHSQKFESRTNARSQCDPSNSAMGACISRTKPVYAVDAEGVLYRNGGMTVSSFENSAQLPKDSMTSFQPPCCGGGHKTENHEPWRNLLHDAAPAEHIVQLYQD
jgi:hypothetical protein